jgi:hypothetical protein
MERIVYLVNGKRKFDTLHDALALAEKIFQKTGIIVSVEQKTVKKRKNNVKG